ncbi:MAG: SpoIID/LytB domain-containing protein [bacterium]
MIKPFYYYLIIFILFTRVISGACVFASEDGLIRVRILHKHHPKSITVSESNSNDKTVFIDLNSNFPMYFPFANQYSICIPENTIKHNYCGRLQVYKEKNELLVINIIQLEDYVVSVVLSELGWTVAEAMRAQAVLARTWAISNRHKDSLYDFDDLTHSQVYKGLFPQSEETHKLLAENYGQIVVYQGRPIEVLYHAACSDRVYSAYEIWGVDHKPYLAQTELPNILKTRLNKSSWQRIILKDSLDPLFQKKIETDQPIQYIKTQRDGILGVYVNNYWIGIDDFRLTINRALGWNQIRSNDFTLEVKGKNIIFKGKGFGHLVGLCQEEAVVLAENGYTYGQLLDFFYPGSSVIAMK